ncbi:hypothetical protein BVI434_270004 [Burkholderia vietnamiensis]|nr:hypothetical protein BVI434_270004 [Burkholderia vietnamiensis]
MFACQVYQAAHDRRDTACVPPVGVRAAHGKAVQSRAADVRAQRRPTTGRASRRAFVIEPVIEPESRHVSRSSSSGTLDVPVERVVDAFDQA